MNKLLGNFDFMPYGSFELTDLENAISESLATSKSTLESVINQTNSSWEQTIEPLHHSLYKLNRLWGTLNHLMSVVDAKDIRDAHTRLQEPITDFYVNLGQNKDLYQKYGEIKKNNYAKLNKEQQKVLDNEFRDFYLSGISLPENKQLTFKTVQNNLEQASTKFSQNVLDATDAFTKYVSREELTDVPEDLLSIYHQEAIKDGKDNLYKITLHIPSYLPIMQYCSNRQLREELYKEYVTRASEFTGEKFDNSGLIKEILKLRDEKARILGFNNYGELSLYTKMANTNKQVIDFLYELAHKSKPYAINDLNELKKFALDKFGISDVMAWDMAFFSEKLQQEKYSYSNHQLKQYFQLPIVLDGLFKLIHNLYKIEFKSNPNIASWHQDVQIYDVFNSDKKIIGTLFLDLYSRNGKHQGAWMNSAQDKYVTGKFSFIPIAYVVCNFANPTNDIPSLLTFDDVQTIFHEIGHALHHLLTEINNYSISGINGVEWDAVELPSQFMEYFAWNYDILKTISKNVDTNEVLPKELYNKLIASRHYQAGLQMLRQLEFAVYDMLLHTESVINLDYMKLLEKVRQEIAVILPPEYNRFPNSFTHIFSGGYASGYYSYKWAEVLATDIFSVFDNQNIDQLFDLGNRFAKTILSQGGLNPMMENFKKFMGREPDVNALLKHSFGQGA